MDVPVRVEAPHNGSRPSSQGRLQDLSFYGAYFVTPQQYEAEDPVEIVLPLGADKSDELRLCGYVLRVEPQPASGKGWVGVAVQFPAPPRS